MLQYDSRRNREVQDVDIAHASLTQAGTFIVLL
jgi:hypothetical protein